MQEQLRAPEIQTLLRNTDNVALMMDSAAFTEMLRKESASNAGIIRQAGIRL